MLTADNFRNNLGDNCRQVRRVSLAQWQREQRAGAGGAAAGPGPRAARVARRQGPLRVRRHHRLRRVDHRPEDLQQRQQRYQHQVCTQVKTGSLVHFYWQLHLVIFIRTARDKDYLLISEDIDKYGCGCCSIGLGKKPSIFNL